MNAIKLAVTSALGEDSGSAPGWSIGDRAHQYTDASSTWAQLSTEANLIIEVKGANDNSPATGAPSIQGFLEDGEELTADTVGIADAGGLGAFSYQWLAGGTAISGATSSTYELTSADVGDAISLTVTFTDGEGFSESLTSAATYAAVASGATHKLLWLGTMEVGSVPGEDLFGYTGGGALVWDHGSLSVTELSVAGVEYTVGSVVNETGTSDLALSIYLSPAFPGPFTLHTGSVDTEFASQDASEGDVAGYQLYSWSNTNLGWSDGQKVTIFLQEKLGVILTPSTLTVAEGSTADYTVELSSEPTADVTVDITGGGDLTVNPNSLTFTSATWNTAKTVTVTAAQDDDGADDTLTVGHAVAHGSAPEYVGTTLDGLPVTVTDDEIPGVTLTPTSLTVNEGSTADYTVELDVQPTADVTVDINGGGDVTVNSNSLTFTSATWNTAKTVTVTAAQDDDGADDTLTVTHAVASSSADEYVGVTVDGLDVTVDDDERLGIRLTPTTLTVNEGSTADYTVELRAQPTADVMVDITGGGDVTVNPNTLTFTSATWNTAKTVTVTAAQDTDAADDAQTVTHAVASGSATEYVGVSLDGLAVTVDDSATEVTVPQNWSLIPTGLTAGDKFRLLFITASGHSPTSSDIADYNTYVQGQAALGHTDIQDYSYWFRVVGSTAGTDARDNTETTYTNDDKGVRIYWLNGSKVADHYGDFYDGSWDDETNPRGVGGAAVSADRVWTGSTHAGEEAFGGDGGTISRALGTSTVRVGRLNDNAEGPLRSTGAFATNTNYPYYALSGVFVVPGVILTPTNLTVNEGSTADYTVELSVQPTADVTVDITGGGDVSVNPTSLTFTATTWDTAQTVTVTAAQDTDAADDAQTVGHAIASSSASEYVGATLDGLAVTVDDDEDPAVTVSFELGTYSVAEGGSVTVKVQLSTDPEREVVVLLTTTNQGGASSGDYSGVPASVTFQSSDTEQSFTFTAAQDTVVDGGESVKLGFGSLPAKVTAGTTNEATVSISQAPTVSATADPGTVFGGGTVTLDGTASDPDGDALTFAWTSDGGGSFAPAPSSLDAAWIAPATETAHTVNLTLTATDEHGLSASVTVSVLVEPAPQPNATTDLRGTVGDDNLVSLTWTLPGQPTGATIANVLVQQRMSGGAFSIPTWDTIATLPASATAHVVGELGANRTFYFRIRLTTTLGASADSRYIRVRTLRGAPAPRHFAASWPTQTSITLDWSTVETAAAYRLEYRKDGETEWNRISGDFDHLPSTTDHRQAFGVAAGLDCNTRYDFRLSARGSGETRNDGNRYPSTHFGSYATTSAQTGECAQEERVTNLLVSVEPSCAILTWTPPSGDRDTGYRVERYSHTGRAVGELQRTPLETLVEEPNRVANRYEDCSAEYRTDDAEHFYSVTALDNNPGPNEEGAFGTAYTSMLRYGTSREPEGPLNVRLTHDTQSTRGLAWDAPRDPWLTTVKTARAGSGPQQVVTDPWTTGYRVERREYRRTEGGGWFLQGDWETLRDETDGDTGTSFTDSEDKGNKQYVYRVWAYNPRGLSLYSWRGDWAFNGGDPGGDPEPAGYVPPSPGLQQGGETPSNTPATGAPAISGAARVGETLTAGTAGIADEDGLTKVSYTYQWTAGRSDIDGASNSTYTLADSDLGKAIQVRVSFEDDAGNAESLTSVATAAVAPRPPLTASLPDSPFQSPRHLGAGDKPQVVVAFSLPVASFEKTTPSVSLTGATVSSVRRHEEDGLENAWIFFLDPDGNGDIVFRLVAGQPCDSGGICTGDWTPLSAAPEPRVLPGPEEEEDGPESPPQEEEQEQAGDDQQTPQSPPPVPTSLTATVNADGHIVLSWTAPDDDSITGYQVLRRRPGEGESALLVYVADTRSTATTFTDTGVTAGVKHVYRVKAINAAGLSGWSNYVNPTP